MNLLHGKYEGLGRGIEIPLEEGWVLPDGLRGGMVCTCSVGTVTIGVAQGKSWEKHSTTSPMPL